MTDYTIAVCSRGFKFFGILRNVDYNTIDITDNLNTANEVSFEVSKIVDDVKEPLWDRLRPLAIIYIAEKDEFYEVQVDYTDNNQSRCIVTGKSLTRAELANTKLYKFNINNENDANWLEAKRNNEEEYPATIFYDEEHTEKSLLHRVLSKVPHYKIGHVDESLKLLQRSFSADGTAIHDFLISEVSDQFNCLFEFKVVKQDDDTYQRIVNVYDLYTVCQNNECNYRGEYSEFLDKSTLTLKCPHCKGTKLKNFGKDTMVYVDIENLTDEVRLSTDMDSIKNCFKLEAGDDVMTATVVGMNPNGSSYRYYFAPELQADMSQSLRETLARYDKDFLNYRDAYPIEFSGEDEEKILQDYNAVVDKYDERYHSVTEKDEIHQIPNPVIGYANLMQFMYESIDLQLYLQSSMMPTPTIQSEVNATTERDKLEQAYNDGDLYRVGVKKVAKYTSASTAETAIKNWAKLFIKSGYVKLKINTISFPDKEEPDTAIDLHTKVQYNYKTWTGTISVINVADVEDVAITKTFNINICDTQFEYMMQKIKKELSLRDDEKNRSLFDVLDYDVLDDNGNIDEEQIQYFKEDVLPLYSMNRLTSFRDAFEGAIDILIAANQSSTDNYLYKPLYAPYYEKLSACSDEMDVRQRELYTIAGDTDNEYIGMQQLIERKRNKIQKALEIETYLGDLYSEFCSYKREDKYSNSNYKSEGLSSVEIFRDAKLFIEAADKQLIKTGTPQHTISTTLYNLYKIPEFAPLKKDFALGNWIRVKANDIIYRLRLISIKRNNADEKNIEVTFSDVTIAPGIVNDIQGILSSAQSMATSYSSVMSQAEKGSVASSEIKSTIENGLDATLVSIKGNTNEQIVIDKLGLTGKSYDDISEEYDQKQVRVTHNIIAFTDDNWKTSRAAIGEQIYSKFNEDGKLITGNVGYGMAADFCIAAIISGSQVIGGDIYSANYVPNKSGSHINLQTGDFDLGGGKLTYDALQDKISYVGEVTLEGGTLEIRDDENRLIFEANLDNKYVSIGGFEATHKDLHYGTSSLDDTTEGLYIGKDGILNYKDAEHYVKISDGVIQTHGSTIQDVDIKCDDFEANKITIQSKEGYTGNIEIYDKLLEVTSGVITNVSSITPPEQYTIASADVIMAMFDE